MPSGAGSDRLRGASPLAARISAAGGWPVGGRAYVAAEHRGLDLLRGRTVAAGRASAAPGATATSLCGRRTVASPPRWRDLGRGAAAWLPAVDGRVATSISVPRRGMQLPRGSLGRRIDIGVVASTPHGREREVRCFLLALFFFSVPARTRDAG